MTIKSLPSGSVFLEGIPDIVILTAKTRLSVTIKVGAGEIWDEVVAKTVDMNLTGIEALSDIPSYSGAAPIQNIGAYGLEIAERVCGARAMAWTSTRR